MAIFDRDIWSFFRPTIWDLIGVAVGVAGIYLSGTILVSVSLNAVHIIEFVAAVVLIASSVVIFTRVRESSAYPFTVHCISVTIVFSTDPTSHAPIGRLSREIEMGLRPNSPERVDRFVWLTDPPKVTEPDIRSRMNFQAKIITGKNQQIIRSVEPQIKLSEFRKLEMFYALPEEAKQFRRFRLIETFVLPNEFPEADEYYDMMIHENAKKRIVRFEFQNMNLVSARFAIIRGKRAPIYSEVDIERDETRNIAFIQNEFGRLRVGDVLSFRWNWTFPGQANTIKSNAPSPQVAVKQIDAKDSIRPQNEAKAEVDHQHHAAVGAAEKQAPI
jgi:hypothetical protein